MDDVATIETSRSSCHYCGLVHMWCTWNQNSADREGKLSFDAHVFSLSRFPIFSHICWFLFLSIHTVSVPDCLTSHFLLLLDCRNRTYICWTHIFVSYTARPTTSFFRSYRLSKHVFLGIPSVHIVVEYGRMVCVYTISYYGVFIPSRSIYLLHRLGLVFK